MYIPRIYSLFHHRKMRRTHDHFVSQSLNIVAFELHKFYRLLRNLLRCVAGDGFFVEQKEVVAAVWKVLLNCDQRVWIELPADQSGSPGSLNSSSDRNATSVTINPITPPDVYPRITPHSPK